MTDAKKLPLGSFTENKKPQQPNPAKTSNAHKILLFSPHPDDECVTGLLPLRLMSEGAMRIVNVAVTLGSKPERRKERLNELEGACAYLGWDIEICGKDGFGAIRKDDKFLRQDFWENCRKEICEIIQRHRPEIIFLPHIKDGNLTHMGVSALVEDALLALSDFSATIIYTEFWRAMKRPNLLVEASAEHLGKLMAATSFHAREVERNPYHVNLPFWMADNVRRASEIIASSGEAAAPFTFGTSYKIKILSEGKILNAKIAPKNFISTEDNSRKEIQKWKL